MPQSYQTALNAAARITGMSPEDMAYLSAIVQKESGFNPTAKNPSSSAFGYGQFLDSTKKAYEKKTGLNYNDPSHQLAMMYQYTNDRYGSPKAAFAFWGRNHWY